MSGNGAITMIMSILHDRHLLNVIAAILGVFATIYGYQGILGQPEGILRRLLVAVPDAAVSGGGVYLVDRFAGGVYSELAAKITGLSVTATSLSAFVFAFVFLISFVSRKIDLRADLTP
jgi:hypothetical protein